MHRLSEQHAALHEQMERHVALLERMERRMIQLEHLLRESGGLEGEDGPRARRRPVLPQDRRRKIARVA
jgi:type II secretory pathway component PulJ